jgi:hypothetical protein
MIQVIDNPPCIMCGEPIIYDDYFEEWQHVYTGDPQCRDKKDNFLYTKATPNT